MTREQNIQLLNDFKKRECNFKELIQMYELPQVIVFFNGIAEINGKKITYDEYNVRFPKNTRDIIIFSPKFKENHLNDENYTPLQDEKK